MSKSPLTDMRLDDADDSGQCSACLGLEAQGKGRVQASSHCSRAQISGHHAYDAQNRRTAQSFNWCRSLTRRAEWKGSQAKLKTTFSFASMLRARRAVPVGARAGSLRCNGCRCHVGKMRTKHWQHPSLRNLSCGAQV